MRDPDNLQHLLVAYETDNLFPVKQHLMSLGLPFQVLHPQAFRQDIEQELQQMKALYA